MLHRQSAPERQSVKGRGSLRRRLILVLAITLLPILLLSAVPAYFDARDGIADRRNALVVMTDEAIDRMEKQLVAAEQVLTIFSSQIAEGECEAVNDRVAGTVFGLSNVLHFSPEGRATCTVVGDAGLEIVDPSWIDGLREGEILVHTPPFQALTTDAKLIGLLRETHDEDTGEFSGAAAFGLRIDSYVDLLEDESVPEDVFVALAGPDGTLYGHTELSAIDPGLLESVNESAEATLFVDRSGSDGPMDLVVREIWQDKLFAVVLSPSPGLMSEASLRPARLVGMPLLAFSLVLLAAWLAMDHLVIRWLVRLRRLARGYGEGRYGYRPSRAFRGAPVEVAALADTLDTMAQRIAERDANLKDAIAVRDAAVREIHHRVKNNLQIVTSFLNLQSRQAHSEEARKVLGIARHRIDALSIVHQTLYQHERLDTVSLQPFLEGLMRHLAEAMGMEEAGVNLRLDLEDTELHADAAIPLALFMLEVVTNSMKYAFPGGRGGEIAVDLRIDETGRARLSVRDNGIGAEVKDGKVPSTGLGSKLMTAFARQLGGDLEIESAVEGGYTVHLDFMVGTDGPGAGEALASTRETA